MRGLQEHMIGVAHEHEGVHPPVGARARLAQGGKEASSVGIIAKNRFAPVAAIQNVIEGALELHPGFGAPLMAGRLALGQPRRPAHCKIHRLIPGCPSC